ncbi:hypothetical protein O181_014589 [Austropuccinia psidii MF-1]|uniref:Uncharacterized protein n=1 Tax=Austropuccinia psidii MF-1 TaxID=1389203 RepID=A0A9Q3C0D4_9BASI|nr:hypothetical protein [Austropuccinia psidii MF-1]
MSFNLTPLPSSLKFKRETPALSHSGNNSDDIMVRTKPDSEHHQKDSKDDETPITSLDFMVSTKPNREHH